MRQPPPSGWFLILIAAVLAPAGWAGAAVQVTVNRGAPIGQSLLRLGVTHTQSGIDDYGVKSAAVNRAKKIISDSAGFQNTHIIGWGPQDINPAPNVYEWDSLDRRIDMMRTMDVPKVITLCTAPGWMKVGGDTWNMEERVKAGYYDDFANLCLKVAKRYPDVKHFQVWNELKGFWSNDDQNWDIVEYTKMYNQVYNKLKGWDPTIKVGGLYLVVSGTGSKLTKETGGVGRDFFEPIGTKDRDVIQYWLDNKAGADFICVDRGIKDGQDLTPYTTDELMNFTRAHGQIVRQVRQMTDLPVWYSEYYGRVSEDPDALAAAYASIYRNMVEAGTSTALFWNPNQTTEGNNFGGLFSDVKQSNGGYLTAHGKVYQWIGDYFGPETPLFSAQTDSLEVEALASDDYTMLINKSDDLQHLLLGTLSIDLLPYEVRLIGADGRFIASTQVVPEPAAVALGAVAAMLLARRGRRAGKVAA